MKTEAIKHKIQETFFSLLQTTSAKKITVSKLCETCKISRSTFYLHYDNVDDLTDYLEKELLYRIEKILKQEQHIPLEEVHNKTFSDLLVYIESRKKEFLFLISKEYEFEFIPKLQAQIEKLLTSRLQFLGLLKEEQTIAIAFSSSGILNLIITQINKQELGNHQQICSAYNELLLTIFKHST